jgi:hypothetical protein
MGSWIRIQAGQIVSKKEFFFRNFMFEEFSVGLEASPGTGMFFVGGFRKDIYDGFLIKNVSFS